jgi:hypothetical protein
MLGGYSEIKLTRLAFLGRWLCLFRHAIPLVSDSQHMNFDLRTDVWHLKRMRR